MAWTDRSIEQLKIWHAVVMLAASVASVVAITAAVMMWIDDRIDERNPYVEDRGSIEESISRNRADVNASLRMLERTTAILETVDGRLERIENRLDSLGGQ